MSYSVFDEEKKLKIRVLNCLFVVVGGLAIVLSGINWFIHERHFYAVALAGFSASSAGLYFWLYTNQCEQRNAGHSECTSEHRVVEAYIFYLSVLVVWGCIASRIDSGLLFWTLLLSTIFYFLLGVRLGAMWSGILLFVILALMFWKLQFGLFNPNMIVNYVASYTSIWAISHYYEKHRQQATISLQHLALRDSLTSTFNRLALEQEFAKYNGSNHHIHFIAFDIDHFKQVNDTYGHLAGDTVLRQVAKRIQAIAGEPWVFRLGGEEFCVLVVNRSRDEVSAMAEAIRRKIADTPFEVDGHQIVLSTSAGIAQSKRSGCLESLAHDADRLLYQAKAAGRNRVHIAARHPAQQ